MVRLLLAYVRLQAEGLYVNEIVASVMSMLVDTAYLATFRTYYRSMQLYKGIYDADHCPDLLCQFTDPHQILFVRMKKVPDLFCCIQECTVYPANS
jgi:hypothetical protein